MSTENAIIELKFLKRGLHKDFDSAKAIDMAIRSLEEWNNLVKEMEEEMDYYDAIPDIWYGISEAFDVIKKHFGKVKG